MQSPNIEVRECDSVDDLLADLIEYLLQGDDDEYEAETMTNKPIVGSLML
jgi:hypothetical protein